MHIFLLLQWHISPVLAWSHRSSGQWVFKVPSGNLIGDGLSHWWAWHHTKILNETRRKTLKSIRDNIPILNANNGLVCNKLHFQKKNEMKQKKRFQVKKKTLRYDLVTDRLTDKSYHGLVKVPNKFEVIEIWDMI